MVQRYIEMHFFFVLINFLRFIPDYNIAEDSVNVACRGLCPGTMLSVLVCCLISWLVHCFWWWLRKAARWQSHTSLLTSVSTPLETGWRTFLDLVVLLLFSLKNIFQSIFVSKYLKVSGFAFIMFLKWTTAHSYWAKRSQNLISSAIWDFILEMKCLKNLTSTSETSMVLAGE